MTKPYARVDEVVEYAGAKQRTNFRLTPIRQYFLWVNSIGALYTAGQAYHGLSRKHYDTGQRSRASPRLSRIDMQRRA